MRLRHVLTAVAAAVGIAGMVQAAAVVLLKVNSPEAAWSTVGITDKLTVRLSRDPALRVVAVDDAGDDLPPFPTDQYNIDSLMDWGSAAGGHYLLLVDVKHERLERRKTWQVPLFFHKYVTVGVIDGELRLIDLVKGKVMAARPFRREREARRIFQASPDDDINDPDLHLTAPSKQVFFDRMERELCDELASTIDLKRRGDKGE